MGQRQLEFPQGKEEICKEEAVESQGKVAESRQTDLQKTEASRNCVNMTAMWPGPEGEAGNRERVQQVRSGGGGKKGRESPSIHLDTTSLCLGWKPSPQQSGWVPMRPCLGVFPCFSQCTLA